MNRTLYLVQASTSATQHILQKLHAIYAPDDHIVFMGENLAMLQPEDLTEFKHCYYLEQERAILNPACFNYMNTLTYVQFADLVLQFERCISLK